METFDVPCDQCDQRRKDFLAEGFDVKPCEENPNVPGMCILRYEPLSTVKAIPIVAPEIAGAKEMAAAENKAKAKDLDAPGPAAAAPTASGLIRHVNVKALNLRKTPSSNSSANVISTLTLGQGVELIGDQQNGWWPIQLLDGTQRGFVKGLIDESNGIGTPSLRVPVKPVRESLVAEAVLQWERFKFGQAKESTAPFFKFIGEMWKAIGHDLDGHDDIPWSAAAISFMVRKASEKHEIYKKFKFNASHSVYINDAIAKAGEPGVPFHGFRLFEHKPQLGDLVARSRENAISFEQAATSSAFKSHTDIIVAVHADAVFAIGGNVSDSVSVTRYPKTDSGHLSDAGGVFALIKNTA